MKKYIAIFLSVITLLCSCGANGRAGKQQERPSPRHFQLPEVPTVCRGQQAAVEYLVDHYWDLFLGGRGVTDTSSILGVPDREFEKALADYLGMLDMVPMPRAQKSVSALFDGICRVQRADTSSHFYTKITEKISLYLYDPNSPCRNEDYYLPFVSAMAGSELTKEEMLPGYEFEARMCSLNRFGQKVPDFRFRTSRGRTYTLYGIKADYTLLFFSNPGCTACKTIIDALVSIPGIDDKIADGRVAVVNVYIDREIDEWLEYEPNYPRNWICGYDPDFVIRDSLLYNVRAIPSLYLLDADKCVIAKDAPTEKVTAIISNL